MDTTVCTYFCIFKVDIYNIISSWATVALIIVHIFVQVFFGAFQCPWFVIASMNRSSTTTFEVYYMYIDHVTLSRVLSDDRSKFKY